MRLTPSPIFADIFSLHISHCTLWIWVLLKVFIYLFFYLSCNHYFCHSIVYYKIRLTWADSQPHPSARATVVTVYAKSSVRTERTFAFFKSHHRDNRCCQSYERMLLLSIRCRKQEHHCFSSNCRRHNRVKHVIINSLSITIGSPHSLHRDVISLCGSDGVSVWLL